MSKREEKVTEVQKTCVLEFMEEHSDFAKGKLLGVEGRKTWNALWEVLTERLNNVGGPVKSTAKWQRVWTDLKNKTKKKAAEIKNSRRRTGGGPPSLARLNDADERIISFLTEEAVYGIDGPDGTVLESEEPNPKIIVNTEEPSTIAITPNREELFFDGNEFSYTQSVTDSEVSETAVDSTATTPKRTQKKKSTAQEAVDKFSAESRLLNQKMDAVVSLLGETLQEKKKFNEIMTEMLEERKKTRVVLEKIADCLGK